MKEVELRARIDSIKGIIEKLHRMGAKDEGFAIQEDIYYRYIFDKEKKGVVRLRDDGKKITLTAKVKVHEKDVCWNEEEIFLELSDKKLLQRIFPVMLFYEECRIKKKRRKFTIGEYKINVDEVEGLGCFIEVELKGNEDTDIMMEKIRSLLRKLGIDETRIINKGYVQLVMEVK